MRRYKILLIAILSCLGAGAQTLTIDSCRTLALQNNKDKQIAALTTQQALYTKKSTHAMFFPDFSLRGLGLYDTGEGTHTLDFSTLTAPLIQQIATMASAYGLTLPQLTLPTYDIDYKTGWMYSASLLMKQPIYMGGKIRAAYAMSKTAVEMSRENERLTDTQVIQNVDEAYAQVVKAEELTLVASRYKELLSELEKNVESAVKHGMKMPNDQAKVKVRMNDAELQLRRAQNGVRLAKMNLCHLIGRPLLSEVEVSRQYPEVSDAELLQQADISMRPEVAILNHQAELASNQVKIVKSEMLPQVALLAKYGYTNGLEVNSRKLLDGWNFTGGVTVSIPLYHFGEHVNKLKAAKAKHQQAELDRENKTELMQLELAQAANKLDEARLEVNMAQSSLEQAEENMKLSRQQYDAGFETLSDYLESQLMWQQASESQVDAHFRLYLSSVAYLKAAGSLVQ